MRGHLRGVRWNAPSNHGLSCAGRCVMSVPMLDLVAQYATIKHDVLPAMMQVIETQQFIMGSSVPELEVEIARLSHAKHGIGCASGTDALLLPLKALNLKPGDEVITTPFTFFATAGTIHNAGGTPVFVDILPDTCNIDGEWRVAGELGWATGYSFFPSKNLGAWGDGGMIVTSDDAAADRLKKLRLHGGAKQYHHEEVGTNSRLDTLQAAVLLAKLPHLAQWSTKRREHAAYYTKALADIPEVKPPVVDPANEHIFHQYTVRAERRDELQGHLKKEGIGHAVYYPVPLHRQPCFADLGYKDGSLPQAERASREVMSLPIYPELTPAQRDRVIDTIRGFYR